MIHGLNKVTLTIANASAYGTGWTLTDAGQLTVEGMTGYVTSTVYAAVQPMPSGSRRRVEDAGTQIEGRLKLWFYKDSSGSFPTVRGGPDLAATLLPTLVQRDGLWFEVQLVKSWAHGLLPHIYAEAELLGLTRPAEDEDTAPADGGGTDTLVY